MLVASSEGGHIPAEAEREGLSVLCSVIFLRLKLHGFLAFPQLPVVDFAVVPAMAFSILRPDLQLIRRGPMAIWLFVSVRFSRITRGTRCRP
jgi:hypothetical protein